MLQGKIIDQLHDLVELQKEAITLYKNTHLHCEDQKADATVG